MLSILLTVLPVFLVAGAGYSAAKTGFVDVQISKHLNAFTVRIAIPCLLFISMYNLDFHAAFNLKMLSGYYIGGIACFIIARILATTVWKRPPTEAVAVGFSALFTNTVLLGLPIVERAYGTQSLTPVFAIISLHVAIMYSIGMISMEFAARDGASAANALKKATKSILSNPLMIGALLGALTNLSGIKLFEPIQAAIKMVASAGIPAALIAMGAALTQYKIKSQLGESLMVASLSLFLQPLIALLITHYYFDLSQDLVRAAVIVGAMPPGMNIYIFATMYNRAENLAASALIISTLLSIFTISFWIWLLVYLGI
ncbi:MAG: AEC family transporter [Nitratireductor sp.]